MMFWLVTRIVSVLCSGDLSLQSLMKLESQSEEILKDLPSFLIFGMIAGVGFLIHGKFGSGVSRHGET